MNYIAHCDGEREQSILEHLQGTAEKAKDFAEVFEKGDWGYCCGMLHDIGKYSDKFQRRIRGEEIKVDHATAGARVCMELGGMYPFLEMCIAGHHAGLSDYGVSTDTGNSSTTLGRRKKKIEDFYAYKKEVKIPELKTSPVNVEKTKDLNFSLSMFTRMMYSCLVDADFLDTEEFMTEERSGRQQGQEIQVLLDKLEKYITEWLKNTETESVNGRRTEILKACLENGEREKGLFRLTVPTGGGKTVASLAFALSLALDMIEELRAVLADRFVLSLVNKKIVNGKNFTKKENGAVLMDDELRKKLLVEWQKKKKETITHPFLKEKVEWGMVPYVQAMLLARYLRGDLDSYPVFLWK